MQRMYILCFFNEILVTLHTRAMATPVTFKTVNANYNSHSQLCMIVLILVHMVEFSICSDCWVYMTKVAIASS